MVDSPQSNLGEVRTPHAVDKGQWINDAGIALQCLGKLRSQLDGTESRQFLLIKARAVASSTKNLGDSGSLYLRDRPEDLNRLFKLIGAAAELSLGLHGNSISTDDALQVEAQLRKDLCQLAAI